MHGISAHRRAGAAGSAAAHLREAARLVLRHAALCQALCRRCRHRLRVLVAAVCAHVDFVPADAGVLQALEGAKAARPRLLHARPAVEGDATPAVPYCKQPPAGSLA